MNAKYTYFVVVHLKGKGTWGVGNREIERSKLIKGFSDIMDIEKAIMDKDESIESCIVTNYILLNTEIKEQNQNDTTNN